MMTEEQEKGESLPLDDFEPEEPVDPVTGELPEEALTEEEKARVFREERFTWHPGDLVLVRRAPRKPRAAKRPGGGGSKGVARRRG